MKIDKAMDNMQEVARLVQEIFWEDGRFVDPSEIQYDEADADAAGLHRSMWASLRALRDLTELVEFYSRPVVAEGYPVKNSRGRYELDGIEFTSGFPIECLRVSSSGAAWIRGTVEHDGMDYVCNKMPLDSIRIRARG